MYYQSYILMKDRYGSLSSKHEKTLIIKINYKRRHLSKSK